MKHTSTDNLRVDYITEINLQFELRSRIQEMENTGATVGSERLKQLIINSQGRCQKLDEEIMSRIFKTN